MKTELALLFVSGVAAACVAASVVEYKGEIGAGSGWNFVNEEAGKIVYVPFEGFYESKGGRIESPHFKLDKTAGENAWYKLTFSAKSETDGYWWVDFYDADGVNLNDVNSRLYASQDWRDYEVMVPDVADATDAGLAFISKKGAYVKDVTMERVQSSVVASWCDNLYKDLPQLDFTGLDGQWEKLPRSLEKIKSGKELHILFLGDSIVNDTYCGNVSALIQRALPGVKLHFTPSVRGCTGCWYYCEPENFEKYVARHKPDLVVIGGISNTQKASDPDYTFAKAEDDMVETILRCHVLGIEAVLCTPAPSYEWREFTRARKFPRGALLAEARAPFYFQSCYIRKAAARTNVPLWDLTNPPCNAISLSGQPLGWFKRDKVHNDDRGKQLIARTLAEYFALSVKPMEGK